MSLSPAPEEAREGEVILLVEPELQTRKKAALILSGLGYRVLEASDALEACAIYKQHGTEIRLLLTEAPMPRVDGHRLATMLSSRNPELRVAFLSDAEYGRLARRAASDKGLVLVLRPFTAKTLAGKVRQALASRPMGAPGKSIGRYGSRL